MRPSEPFVTSFLSDDRWRNVTSEQVNRQIYPFGTYSYLCQLCIVFLITDILRLIWHLNLSQDYFDDLVVF